MKSSKTFSQYEESVVMPIEIVLSANEFNNFLDFLNIIKPEFNDFCLVDGSFRSRANDMTFIVETGFSFLKGAHFYISNINLLVKMISSLNKQRDITIGVDETAICFSDKKQIINLPQADASYSDNKYVSDPEMDSIIFSNIDLGKIFINETISKNSFATIKKMANNLNCISYQIIHDKNDLNKGVLCISKNNDYKQSPAYMLNLNKNLLIPMKRNHSFVVSTLPTIFNKYNMLFRCYHANNGPLIFMIYNTKVNDIYVNLYGRSALVKNS